MKTHNKFMEEVKEASREPTPPEKTSESLFVPVMNPELFEKGRIKKGLDDALNATIGVRDEKSS